MAKTWTAAELRLTPAMLLQLRAMKFFTGDGRWSSLKAEHFFTPTYRALHRGGFFTVKGLYDRKNPREGFRRYRITAKGKAAVERAAPAVKAAADRLEALADAEFQERQEAGGFD